MWAVAYLALMQPGLAVGEFLFAATLACLFAGGVMVGRWTVFGESAALAGLKVGLLVAALNMLIVGALLVDPQTQRLQPRAAWWIAGDFGVSMILATTGAIIGRRFLFALTRAKPGMVSPNWFCRFTVVAAATVILLLITGGLVTGLKAGLAVPDWPTSFGHNMLLYPLAEMSGGKFFEHAHRLYGMLVGVTAIALVIASFMFDQRRWFRLLAIAYLLMVCAQGYMGGMRVTETSTALAILHGMFGQVVFATMVCMAGMASTTWEYPRAPNDPRLRNLVSWTTALLVVLLLQLGLGAVYRHLQRAMEDPPQPLHVLYTHILVAFIVTLLVIFTGGRAWGRHREQPVLPAIGLALLSLVGLQWLLGAGAMVVVWMSDPRHMPPAHEVVITTAHQINGALLLAVGALLMLWTRRLAAITASAAA